MRKAIIVSSSFFISLFAFAQKQSIELELMGKYGVQSKSNHSTGLDIWPAKLKAIGFSAGAGLNYKRRVGKNLYAKIGAGYNRLTISKVENIQGNTKISTRSFNYQYLGYGYTVSQTGRYSYDNLMFSTGASYEKNITKNLKLTFSGDIVYLYTLAQRYHYGTECKDPSDKYNENFSLALGLNANAGLLYKIKNSKFYLNPKIVLPVYQRMFADKVLYEDNSYNPPQKWLGGAGLSVSVGRYF